MVLGKINKGSGFKTAKYRWNKSWFESNYCVHTAIFEVHTHTKENEKVNYDVKFMYKNIRFYLEYLQGLLK